MSEEDIQSQVGLYDCPVQKEIFFFHDIVADL